MVVAAKGIFNCLLSTLNEKKLQECNKCGCFLVGGLMSKQLRVTLVVGVAIAISLFVSACGGNPSTTPANGGTTPTSGGSPPSYGLGTPGHNTCVPGSITASGSPPLEPPASA